MSYLNPLTKVNGTTVTSKTATKVVNNSKEETVNTTKEDVFVKGDSNTKVTYSKPVVSATTEKADKADRSTTVAKLLEEQEKRINSFKQMISSMITKQGEKSNVSIFNLKLTVSKEDSIKAQEAISEDGEWGVNAVATRIMDMAESFIGTDKSLFSTIKNAVIEGYAQAEKAWGGKLPSICGNTMDEINSRFDALEKDLFGEE